MKTVFLHCLSSSAALSFAVFAFPLWSLPQGIELVSGKMENVEATSSSLVLEVSDRAILHWDQFSIEKGEQVHFCQSSQSASVLNRVVGGEASRILGKMSSNGIVFLLNPQGILVGPEGRIEAAGFFASTAELKDASFLGGRELQFEGDSLAWIEQQGTIVCPEGTIFLLAQKIVNRGEIRGGEVALIAGQKALFQPNGFERQFFQTRQTGAKGEWTGANFQDIDPYRAAIFQDGTVEARFLKEGGEGEILLLADAGLCQVEGELFAEGGKIHVLGEEIQILNQARLDVSGKTGGGEILVGGDFQGSNPSIPQSAQTFVSREALLKADALESGSGGKVIVWGDERTVFAGKASARGGSLKGDGGLVEVSAPSLRFLGAADLQAPRGKTGELLLDPTNVTISNADSGGSFGGGNPNVFTPSGTDNTIAAATLEANLASANVTITTTSGSAQAGDITVSDAVSWSTANTLTLTAEGRVTINNTLTSTNASTFQALTITGPNSSGAATTGNGITVNSSITAVGGHITLNGTAKTTGSGVAAASVTLSTTTGNLSITGQGGNTGASNIGIVINSSTVSTVDGTITLQGTGGPGSSGSNRGISLSGDTISASGAGAIEMTAQGGAGGSNNWGMFLASTTIFVTDGNLTIVSTAGNSGSNNYGIYSVTSGSIYTAGLGNIDITGNGRSGGGLLLERPIYGDTGSTGSISLTGNVLSGTAGDGVTISNGLLIGGANTSNISITATTQRSSSTFVVAAFIVGRLQVKDGGTITLNGTGSSGSNPSANEHYGVCLHEFSTVTLGSSAGGCSLNITGVSGSGSTNCTGSRNVGNIVCNGTNNTINYTGCKAGAGSSGNNRGVFWTSGLSGAPSVTFTNINTSMPGGSYGANSHGVNFAGNTPTFNSITCSNVNGAPGTFSCNGFLTTVALTINGSGASTISGTSVGTSSTNAGVQVSGGGDIINSGAGTVSISGTGSSTGTGSLNYGVRLTGSGSTIVAGTGNGGITLSGTAGAGTSYAISIDTSGSLSGTGTGTIAINSSTLMAVASLPTASGPVSISGPLTISTGVTINTANSGSGANITFSGSGTVNGSQILTLTAGTGAISIGTAIGTTTALSQFNATASGGITLSGGTIRTAAGTATLTGPVTLSGTAITIDTTNNGSSAAGNNITFSGSTSTINGAQNLTLTAGSSGVVALQGTIGLTTAPTQLTVSGAGITLSGGAIRTAGGAASFTGPVTLATNPISVDTTNNGGSAAGNNITFSSTINGAQTLSLAYGTSGVLSLGGAIGGTTSVTGLTIVGASIPLNRAVTTGVGGVTLTGSSAITLSGGTITTASGPYLSTGPVTLATNNLTIDTSSGGGANITFSGSTSTINGARNLTLTAGTGAVELGGTVGLSTALTQLGVSGAGITLSGGGIRTAAGTATFTGPVTLASNAISVDTTNNGGSAAGNNITFSSTINGAQNLTLTAGSSGVVALQGTIGLTTAPTQLGVSGAGITLSGGAIRTAAGTATFTGPVTLATNPISVDTTNNGGSAAGNNITFSSTINGAQNLTLTAGSSGVVALQGTIGLTTAPTQLGVSGAGITLSGGAIRTAAGTATFTGPVTLASNAISVDTTNNGGSAAGNNITFSSTINGAQDLTLTAGSSGVVALQGTIGLTTALTQLGVSGAGITLSGGAIRTAAGTAAFTGPVTLATNPISVDTTNNGGSAAGNNITFSSTINGAQNLTLTAGSSGVVALQGTIGLTTALTQLGVSGAGITLSGGGIRTAAGTAAFTGPVTLASNAISVDTTNNGGSAAGNNITFSSTINGAQNLTLTAGSSGVVALQGTIGLTTALTQLGVSGAGITLSGGGIRTAAGTAAFTGPVTLATNPISVDTTNNGGSPAGSNITFSSTINGAQALTLAAGSGTVGFGGAIGGTTPISSLSSTAATTQFGGNATIADGGALQITGSTALAANAAFSTGSGVGSMSFSSNITGAFSLSLTTGSATFSSTVGSPAALTSLEVAAPAISVQGAHSVSSGPMAYTGDVTLNAAQTFANGGASGTTFTGDISGNYSLLIQAPSSTVAVTGGIDTSGTGAGGAQVMISADSDISVGGVIDTRGGDAPMMGPLLGDHGSAGASVVLTSSSGSITVTQIDTSGGDGTLTGGNAGDILLQPTAASVTGALGVLPDGKVVLSGTPSVASTLTANGGSGATPGNGGTVSLGAVGRTEVQSVATITCSLDGNDITISCDAFSMEPFEAMTAYGSITIHPISSAQVGDLVATEDITISSSTTTPTILLQTHGEGELLDWEGELYLTDALHFDYTGTLTLNGTLVPPGPYDDSKVALSPAEFQTLLLYAPDSLILNYDQAGSPIPPPSPTPVTEEVLLERARGVNALLVAGSELTDWLNRLYKNIPFYQGKVEKNPKKFPLKRISSSGSEEAMWTAE